MKKFFLFCALILVPLIASTQAPKNSGFIQILQRAEQGDRFAQYSLGCLYYNGTGVDKDYDEAVKWWQKAAEQGDVGSQLWVGHCYNYGWGVVKNVNEAAKWYQKAVEQGNSSAMYYLGCCYYKGEGVNKNYDEAAKWWEKGAILGDVGCQVWIGRCYNNGWGVVKNVNEAIKWYRKAAEQGNAEALKLLKEKGIVFQSDKPTIHYINLPTNTATNHISIRAGIKSSTKVSNIEFSINGQVERGINVVNSNEYDAEFKRDIVLNEGTNTIKLSVTNAAGTVEDVRTITYTPTSALKPQIIWDDMTAISRSKTYNLDVSVKSSSKIEYANVYVNGQLERGIVVSPTTIGDMDIKRTITLKEGQNSIKIEVKNIDGVSVIERTVTYTSQSLQPVTTTQKRLALVIGNSNYSSATKLPNPVNDATDVASKLKALGFEVVEKHDLTIKTFKSAIRDFGARASLYDASIVYYAGHAIERNGKNYLIPVDAVIEVASDIEDECVRADYIIDNLEEAKSKMNIIVLDACRNNPINRSWARSLSGGLSSMTAPTGTFIAFSTAPGHTAADGEGRNSPFTEAFLGCLDKPNLPLELFFKEVLRDVSTKTSNRQIPWTQSSFIGDFYFNIK